MADHSETELDLPKTPVRPNQAPIPVPKQSVATDATQLLPTLSVWDYQQPSQAQLDRSLGMEAPR